MGLVDFPSTHVDKGVTKCDALIQGPGSNYKSQAVVINKTK